MANIMRDLARHHRTLAVGMAYTFLNLLACSNSNHEASCTQGTEDCSCKTDGTCDSSLVCRSNLCVSLQGTGGSSAIAGMSGGASSTNAQSSPGGSGGTAQTGSSALGGSAPTAGTSASGGNTDGAGGTATQASAVGGSFATGGTTALPITSATGGTAAQSSTATGGASPTGGTPSTGGVSSMGGASLAGGISSTGGTSAAGGIPSTGGVSSAGGVSQTGGTSSANTATNGGASSGGTSGSNSNNLITNGDFGDSSNNWVFTVQLGSGTGTVSGGRFCVQSDEYLSFTLGWPATTSNLVIPPGVAYTLSYRAAAVVPASVQVKLGESSPPYTAIYYDTDGITSLWTTYTHEVIAATGNNSIGLAFNGTFTGNTICIDDVSLVLGS